MASVNTLCKKLLNVKKAVVTGQDFYTDAVGVDHIRIHARPNIWHEDDCPFCRKRCKYYDQPVKGPRSWRALDWGGTLVEVVGYTHRINCPEHGIVTADIPWAYPGSGFTRGFDLTVGWLAAYLPRSVMPEYMRIDWQTVGRCANRTLDDIEPERSRRLDNLVDIVIDETSYKKGHKYITAIVNHGTNTVVWAAQGHGKGILMQFYKQPTPDQLPSIRVVTGDGAKWITECVNEFTPDCKRCVDPFHVVGWAMEALDEVRREAWREAYSEAVQLAKEHPRKEGRPRADDAGSAMVKAAKVKAEEIKNAAYALGKALGHLTESQQAKMAMVAGNNNRLYRAYRMKEMLRLLLKIKDTEEAEAALKRWLWWASHSRIDAFKELYLKIRRHREHILNAIRFGMGNARIEATNNKIKLIIRKAYGFRNIQNMLDMVYLVCSDLRVPLPNRKPKAG